MNVDTLIKNTLSEILTEAAVTKVNFAGHEFGFTLDTNEDPQKKGVKIQFRPLQFGTLTQTEQNDIATELQNRLDDGLEPLGLKAERDRDLKDKTIIGYFIYIEYFDKLIRNAMQKIYPWDEESKLDNDTPEDNLDSADDVAV